ncbi:MAG: glutamine synthetase III [Bacteroidales bacterium]|nr:glutamine synthetase III [Bacteroidales bacterium]MBP8677428.1 glutamine synthetase III [Bacteroidales bacterium]MBP9977729.1 glutamine synthetase III [Bacteroidales bacterium]
MSSFRKRALDEFSMHKPERFFVEKQPVSEFFGKNLFDIEKMRRYLSAEAFDAVQDAISQGKRIGREVANQIASGMKAWAVENGATHYTHWFHPLTDATAEKHEAFVDPSKNGGVFENFRGDALVQQEPDASSFPNGGLRNTFEARGYTAWDPTSPAFIIDQTLCIPSVFVSYTGESLDQKTPHLKSLQTLDKAASELLDLFDQKACRVNAVLGIEQEYFLVDEALFRARPDLMLCGRTLIGHTAAKDQQLEDHYFGAIPSRVMSFMKDFETEAYKLGVVLKTRHNEVAPNQFEFAPYHGEANLSVDQNLMMMILMRKIAKRHKLKVLFHEKPFAGINGSGKHCNWSLVTDKGVNLLSPGKTPGKNLQFLSFFVSVIKAVYEHHHLLMASVASLNNSHRLGGNEAPPAVMSVFVGRTLSSVLDSIEKMVSDNISAEEISSSLNVVGKIPEILPDNTDRNRTSPFAFTGNRFEFRAVGSSVNVASSMYILNTAVAQQLIVFKERASVRINGGATCEEAILETIREFIAESVPVRFEGNGYSKEWQEEAARRGLRGISNVPEAFKAFLEKGSIALMKDMDVLSEREVEARYEVMNEIYIKKLQIEARVIGDLTVNHIIPTAIKFQNTLIDNVRGIKDLFGPEEYKVMSERQLVAIRKISGYIQQLREDFHDLVEARKEANKIESYPERAMIYSNTVLPYMESIRKIVDKLEMVVDDELWPLPKYRELLFLR